MTGIAFVILLLLVLVAVVVMQADEWYTKRRHEEEELAWSCHFCGAVRLDHLIGVVKRQVSKGHGLTLYETRRYCSDNPRCVQRALLWEGEHRDLEAV